MNSTDRHVIGVFKDRADADMAIEAVVAKGITEDKLSLMVSSDGRGHHFEVDDTKSKTAQGVGYGAVLGGLAAGLGAAAAGLVSVSIPGAVLISGPLAVSLAAGATGAAAGGLAGGLIGVGIPEDEVELVEKELGQGDILIAAHCLSKDEKEEIVSAFKNAGAERVH